VHASILILILKNFIIYSREMLSNLDCFSTLVKFCLPYFSYIELVSWTSRT